MKIILILLSITALVLVILTIEVAVHYYAVRSYCPLKSCEGITIESIGN